MKYKGLLIRFKLAFVLVFLALLILPVKALADAMPGAVSSEPFDSTAGAYRPAPLPLFDGHYYEIVLESVNWATANEAANASSLEGCASAHLATITSQEEQDAIYEALGNEIAFAWLGARQVGDEWQWVTGEPWEYTNWQPGEPSGESDATALHVGGGGVPSPDGWIYDGKWNDTNPDWSYPYMVEYDECLPIPLINVPPVADPDGPYYGYEGSPVVFDGTGSFDPKTLASCQEIRDRYPEAADGEYIIYPDGQWFNVYCHDMAGTPREYLSLVNTSGSSNFSQYTAGGASPGTDVRTYYEKLRIDPDTLLVDISDQTFATSTGELHHADVETVTSMPYGVAMGCASSANGLANIDLRGTPFTVNDTFILDGYMPTGDSVFSAGDQVVDLTGGGNCGWILPDPQVYNPFNDRGDFQLQLAYTGTPLIVGPLTYDWDFGDGSPVAIDAGPTPSHTYGGKGTYSVCLTVRDSYGLSDTNCTTVYTGNWPPIARDDGVFETDEDTALTIPISKLLENDSGFGADLMLQAIGAPAHGTADVGDGNIVYTPAENYHGEDSFLYTITDGEDESAAAVFISVNPINDPPTGISLDHSSLKENLPPGSFIGRFSSADVDEGDSFTYRFEADGYDDNASFSIVGDQLYSAASFDYEGKNSYQILVRTTDSMGATITNAFSIMVENVNENPTMITLDKTTVVENFVGEVGQFSAEDPEGDQITFSLVDGAGSNDNGYFYIDNATLFTKGLDYEEKTTRSIRVRADDGNDGYLEKTLIIEIIDDPTDEPLGVTNCDAKSGDRLTLFSSLENSLEIELTKDPVVLNYNERVCNLEGVMNIKVKGNEVSPYFSGWVNDKNHIISEVIGDEASGTLNLNLAGLTLEAANVSIEYYLESPFLRIANPEIKIPDAWGGLGTTIPNPTVIDVGGLRIGTPEIPDFALPTIKSTSGFELSLNGQLVPVSGGYEIKAKGEFTIPNIGKKTATGGNSQECSIGVGVTIFSGSQGLTSMTLVSLDAIEASASENSVVFRGMSVDMSCTRGIPIGTTGFALTGVSGEVNLTPSNEYVKLGVTISSMKEFPEGTPIMQVNGETEVKLNPFELNLTVTLKVLIFEMAKASATIKENSFTASLHIDILLATGDVTVNAWSKDGSFHFTGTGKVTIGIPERKWGEICIWYPCGVKMCRGWLGVRYPCGFYSCYACTGLPPVNLELGSTGCQFGEFTNGAYGLKGFVSYSGISYGYYIDHTGKLSFGNVDKYQLLENPYSSSSLLDQGYSRQLLSPTYESVIGLDEAPSVENDLQYIATIAEGDTSFSIISNEPLDVELKDPNGNSITPTDNPDNVQYEQIAYYELEESMNCDEQELPCESEEGLPRLRFVLASPDPDLDQVNVKIDGNIIFNQVKFTDTVHQDYIPISPGVHEITFEGENVSKTIEFEALPNQDYTVVTLGNATPFATVLEDTNISTDKNVLQKEPGIARVRVVSGSESGELEVLVGGNQAEVCSPSAESYPVICEYQSVPAGAPTLEIRSAGNGGLSAPRTVDLVEGKVYSIYIADIENDGYSLDWMQTLEKSYKRIYHTAYNVDQAEPGTWQVMLNDVPDNASYEVHMLHSGKPPVLKDLTINDIYNGEVNVNWQLTTETSPTLVTIYATQGPITQSMVVSATETTDETITLPKFEGTLVYEENITFEQGDGIISRSHPVDLSKLESGEYYLWISANDGINPPVSGYFVSPEYADSSIVDVTREGYDPLEQLEHSIKVEVDQSGSFPDKWSALITPLVDPERHQVHIYWDLLDHPDIDRYRVHVTYQEGGEVVEEVIDSTSVINVYDENDGSTFHTKGYAKVDSIQTGLTYTLQIEAQDLDSGKSVSSQEMYVAISSGNFELSAGDVPPLVKPGDEITIPISLVVKDKLYYPFVNLGIDAESAPYGIKAQFAGDYMGSTMLSDKDSEASLKISIAESTKPKNHDIYVYGYNGGIKETLKITLYMNTPPAANNDTVTTDEDTEISIDVLSNDNDIDENALTAVLVSGPDHGTLALQDDGSFSYTPNTNYNGSDSFTYKASDGIDESNVATVSITINPVNDPPEVTVSPQNQVVQYSDGILPVTISAEDIDSPTLTIDMALPDWLELSDGDCSPKEKGLSCMWVLTGVPNVGAEELKFTLIVSDGDGGQGNATVNITVAPEDSYAIFHSGNPVAVRVAEDGGNSGLFELEVRVRETYPDQAPDGTIAGLGDISLAQVSMKLVPVGPGFDVPGVCSVEGVYDTGYEAFQRVVCSFDAVQVNTYLATASMGGGYYAGSDEDVLVVYDPSRGYTTGGGSFIWPGTADLEAGYAGDRTNFGYTMEYNKNGTNVKGGLLLIRHLEDGSTYQVKSNALYGLSLGVGGEKGKTFGWASFSGKATYLEPGWLEAIGNYEFLVYVEDRDEPGVDRFWIELKDKDRKIVPVISMPRKATEYAEDLHDGEVFVPH